MSFDHEGFYAWLLTRPLFVQELAKEFPPWIGLRSEEAFFWVIGWDEDGAVLVTPLAPGFDYEAAYEARQPLHLACARRLAKVALPTTYDHEGD